MSDSLDLESQAGDRTFTEPISLSPRATRRFYEAIVFLVALTKCFRVNATSRSNGVAHDTGASSDVGSFQSFVSRLAQICDSRPGGSTVTAFGILQHPDKIEYVFGSNKRKSVELETTKGYIHAILKSLVVTSSCEDDDEREAFLSNLLRDVLIFNRDRVKCYVKRLKTALESCISNSAGDMSSLARKKDLDPLLDLAQLPEENNDDECKLSHLNILPRSEKLTGGILVMDRIENLINALQSLQKPAMALFLRRKATNDKAGNSEPWRHLQHCSSRILAYRRAVEALWEASCIWPELVERFEVTIIPSSSPASNPLSTGPQKASEILKRLLPDTDDSPSHMEQAESMQRSFQLDERIEAEWTSSTFRPIVHAEILVLNYLERTGGTRPDRFFGNWQYIGSSKPTCKLCHYYFHSHPSGVEVRGTHGNLYRNWMMPDYADVHGLRTKDEALAKRHEILQAIVVQLRQCVLRTLSEKRADGRTNDSITISSLGYNWGQLGVSARNRAMALSDTRRSSLTGIESWLDPLDDYRFTVNELQEFGEDGSARLGVEPLG